MTLVERRSRGSRFVAYALIGIMLTAMGYGMGVWSAPVTSFGIDGSGNFHGNEVHVNDVVSEGDVHTSSLYVEGYYPGSTPSYTVGINGATYWARNETTGDIATNANAVTLIQSCLDDANRGDVFLKDGTYIIGSGLVIYGSERLIGSKNTILDIRTCTTTAISTNTGNSNIDIINLQFEGDNDQTAILSTSNHVTVSGCRFNNVKWAVFIDTSAYQNSVINNWFNGGTIGVWVRSANTVFIRDNTFQGMSGVAVQISTAGAVETYNVWVEDNTMKDAGYLVFYGSISVNCVTTNIYNLHINKNNIVFTANPANEFNGIVLDSESNSTFLLYNVEVRGNNIMSGSYANSKCGVYLHGTAEPNVYDNIISENHISGFTYGIINTAAANQFNSIINNIIRNCVTPVYDDGLCYISNNPLDLTLGLVLYQPMEDITANRIIDATQYRNDGVNYGATPTASGKIGDALTFSTGNYTLTADTLATINPTTEGTICFWFKSSGAQDAFSGFVDKKWNTATAGISFAVYRPNAEEIKFSISSGAAMDTVTKAFDYTNLNWHFIVARWNTTTIFLSVDLVETYIPQTVNAQILNQDVRTGYFGASIKGTIDEMRIYTRSLTSEEISQLYYAVALPKGVSSLIYERLQTNSGTATLLNGQTTIAVTHGLSYTPTVGQIRITWAENPTNVIADWWVDTITSTQFTLNGVDPGASNLDFGWSITKTP